MLCLPQQFNSFIPSDTRNLTANRKRIVSIKKSIEQKQTKNYHQTKKKKIKRIKMCGTFNCKVQSKRVQRQHASISIKTSKISIIGHFDELTQKVN